MKRYKRFSIFWLINIALLYGSYMFLPVHFALGNNLFTPFMAAVFTAFIWNIVLWNIEPMFTDLELEFKSPLSMMLSYLAVNFATLWLLARMAFTTGFGVSSFVYIFGLAFIANLLQYQAWLWMEKQGKGKKKK